MEALAVTQGWTCPACNRTWAPHVDTCRVCTAALDQVAVVAAGTAALTVREIFVQHYEPWGKKKIDCWKSAYSCYFKHVIRLLGDRRWTEVTYDVADEYAETRSKEFAGNSGKPVANATINRELAVTKAMLNWSIRRRPQVIPGPNPLDKYPRLSESEARRFHITERDFVRLLEQSGRLLRQMLIVSFETGMRRDEFRLLEWAEVDLENAVIRLPKHRVKGKKKGRSIPLTDVAVAVLSAVHRTSERWVFANPRGDRLAAVPVAKTTLYRWFCEARLASGVKGPNGAEVWVHTLRKSFGTINAMESRVSIYHLMQIMGHTSKSAHDEYTQISEEYLNHTRGLLNARRGPKPTTPPVEEKLAEPSPLQVFVDKGRHKGE